MNNSSLHPASFFVEEENDERRLEGEKRTEGYKGWLRRHKKSHIFSGYAKRIVTHNEPVEAFLCPNPSLCKRWFVHACACYTGPIYRSLCNKRGVLHRENLFLSPLLPSLSLSLDMQYECNSYSDAFSECTKSYALRAIYARRGERERNTDAPAARTCSRTCIIFEWPICWKNPPARARALLSMVYGMDVQHHHEN